MNSLLMIINEVNSLKELRKVESKVLIIVKRVKLNINIVFFK